MKPQTVYTVVDVKDELPKEKGWHLCKITDADNKINLHCDCPYDAELKQFGDIDEDGDFMPLYNAIVTHWLKEQPDRYVFSKEELVELLKELHGNNFAFFNVRGADDIAAKHLFQKFLISKNLAE